MRKMQLISTPAAARILGLTRQRVWQLIQSGDLPAYTDNRTIMLDRAVVEKYRDKRTAPSL